MAKSGKIVQLFQKPESFIKSRARQLQQGKCYVSANWEESGIANVMVSRIHVNGNFTVGMYLIDFKCLGIKDSAFKFNIPGDELDYLVKLIGGEEMEYNTVHNMLYGAEAFAESCGFMPHKDWAIGQLILEEDDARIPIIDIPFGEEGVPAYYVGPYDDAASINRVLATLDKHVGPGNYYFFPDDEPGDLC